MLLRTARDLAAQAGDVSVTIEAIDQIAANYDLDPLEMQAKAVTKLSKSASAVTAQRDLVDAIATIIDTAINKDEYAVARQLAGLAVTVARKTKEPSLLKTAVARSKEIDEDAAAYKEAQESLKLLEEKPNDPDANLVVGKFKCFIKGDWQNGLPFLFRSNDATFKDLAEKELGDTSEPEVKSCIRGRLVGQIGKETGSARDHLRLRAAYWYKQALPELRGLSKAKTEKRLAEFPPGTFDRSAENRPSGMKEKSEPIFEKPALNDPAFKKWTKDVATLPPERQVDSVIKKLQELNPDFDGKETHKINDGVVTELQFITDNVDDISPVRALPGLNTLSCEGTEDQKGKVSDLSPLKGMRLTALHIRCTKVSDLSPLKGMPLTFLHCPFTSVSELSPLHKMPLTKLDCGGTQVSDLLPLKGMRLEELWVRKYSGLRSVTTQRNAFNIPALPWHSGVTASATARNAANKAGLRRHSGVRPVAVERNATGRALVRKYSGLRSVTTQKHAFDETSCE